MNIDISDLTPPEQILHKGLDYAINSLKAWDSVRTEIKDKVLNPDYPTDYQEGYNFGLMTAYQIIEKHMPEVET